MHTSLLVAYRGKNVRIDCGETWRGKLDGTPPAAIVVTHAHPDHVGGLIDGARCPVYASEQAWQAMAHFPIRQRHTILPQRRRQIAGITFEAFDLEHSLNAPAFGYRITAGHVTIFYSPDVVYIHEREAALHKVQVYIGDGATLARPLVRRRGKRLIGHAPVQTQLTWCQKEGVPRAIITHCGSEIVAGNLRKIRARLAQMASDRGVQAELAHDGMQVFLRGRD
jgi:phosphoribosyl 1,2-cyclic phosphodiesterase